MKEMKMIPDFIKSAHAMAMRYMYNGSITDMTVHQLFMIVDDTVSIKRGLRTADHGLRTGYKTRTRYKMWTTD